MPDLTEAELERLNKLCRDWRISLADKADIHRRYFPQLIAEVRRLRTENAELRRDRDHLAKTFQREP